PDLDNALDVLPVLETLDCRSNWCGLTDRPEEGPRARDVSTGKAQSTGLAGSLPESIFVERPLFGRDVQRRLGLNQREAQAVANLHDACVEQQACISLLARAAQQHIENGVRAGASERLLDQLEWLHATYFPPGTIFPNLGISTWLVYSSCFFRS